MTAFFATAAANLAGLLPSAPGSIGTFHFFAAWAYALHNISWDTAVGVAVVAHAVMWLPMTAVGVVSLLCQYGSVRHNIGDPSAAR